MPTEEEKLTPFAESKSGDLCVMISSFMSPLIEAIEDTTSRLPVIFFDGDKAAYMTIDNAIEWVENKCQENPRYKEDRGRKALKVLKLARDAYNNGKIEESTE